MSKSKITIRCIKCNIISTFHEKTADGRNCLNCGGPTVQIGSETTNDIKSNKSNCIHMDIGNGKDCSVEITIEIKEEAVRIIKAVTK